AAGQLPGAAGTADEPHGQQDHGEHQRGHGEEPVTGPEWDDVRLVHAELRLTANARVPSAECHHLSTAAAGRPTAAGAGSGRDTTMTWRVQGEDTAGRQWTG